MMTRLECSFQARVDSWMQACFGPEISGDLIERNHRFIEEGLELVQACGMTKSEAHQLVDYVFGRPVGERSQEVGGAMVTLAALCLAQGLEMHAAGEAELARVWVKIQEIRAKQAAKPKHSPLPEGDQKLFPWPEEAGPAPPLFITFTGADEKTSIEGMEQLSRLYPIEWGILFSPNKQGEGRYPPLEMLDRLREARGLQLSAHLCGGHSRAVFESGACWLDDRLPGLFARAQINGIASSPPAVMRWAARVGVIPILQCRGQFPDFTGVAWLFDRSGGRGVLPSSWPPALPNRACGYAGGIRPENVRDVLSLINAGAADYWIDLESGVRDGADRFSLEKCRQVCEAVYGKRPAPWPLIGNEWTDTR